MLLMPLFIFTQTKCKTLLYSKKYSVIMYKGSMKVSLVSQCHMVSQYVHKAHHCTIFHETQQHYVQICYTSPVKWPFVVLMFIELTIANSDLWTFPLLNFMQTGQKCRKYGKDFICTFQSSMVFAKSISMSLITAELY